MTPQHTTLAAGRWRAMTLAEQLGNIGSEVHRARLAQGKNDVRFQAAVDRALELFDLTRDDPRWHGRLFELARARDVFTDAVLGGIEYGSTLEKLEPFFDRFALLAQRH